MSGLDRLHEAGTQSSRSTWILTGAALVALCALARWSSGPHAAQAKAPRPGAKTVSTAPRAAATPPAAEPESPPAEKSGASIVAMVNGSEITREELAKLCLWHFGTEVLESLVNKTLIAGHCQAKNISITPAEVDAEVNRMAERFGLPRDQWLKLLKQERKITPEQYARDIIWPTLALRKLADKRLTVSQQELLEAYETQFGAAVKVRLIACTDPRKAERIHAQAVAHPDQFGDLAKQYSDDVNSASAKGLIQPIRRHLGDKGLEEIAFGLEPGQISPVVQVANQFVFVKCEEHLPAEKRALDEELTRVLTEAIRDKKLRLTANDLFRELQDQAQIQNIYNDPAQRAKMPGVAAIINGQQITVRQLADECIARHGEQVLEGAIQRRIVEQAIKKHKLEITPADVEAELAATAQAMGKIAPDGTPDIAAWLAQVQDETGADRETYVHDTVWPTVALKKLVGSDVEISEEDIQKGFQANYGPRVRCRAIVFSSQRRAQEVWEMARKNPTVEYFGDLAEQYSIETSSRMLRGEVPPIQKWGGEPALEEEAFSLQAGELSGIVQVGEQFVILFCEGQTQPLAVELNEVRPLLIEDLREKKLRLAMSERFDQLQAASQIDNYLAQTSHSPQGGPGGEPRPVSIAPDVAPVPRAGSPTAAAAGAGGAERKASRTSATAPARR